MRACVKNIVLGSLGSLKRYNNSSDHAHKILIYLHQMITDFLSFLYHYRYYLEAIVPQR
jgi:hypothetical protein